MAEFLLIQFEGLMQGHSNTSLKSPSDKDSGRMAETLMLRVYEHVTVIISKPIQTRQVCCFTLELSSLLQSPITDLFPPTATDWLLLFTETFSGNPSTVSCFQLITHMQESCSVWFPPSVLNHDPSAHLI